MLVVSEPDRETGHKNWPVKEKTAHKMKEKEQELAKNGTAKRFVGPVFDKRFNTTAGQFDILFLEKNAIDNIHKLKNLFNECVGIFSDVEFD